MAQLGAAFCDEYAVIIGYWPDRFDLAIVAAMNHVGVAMGRKRWCKSALSGASFIALFGNKTLKCHQHYYISTLPGRQWPKIDAFIGWLRELAG